MRISGGLDVANSYMFRGLRQDRVAEQMRRGNLRTDRDMIIAPHLDLGVRLYQGQGDLRAVGIRVETANRLHTGPTGRRGDGASMWNASALTLALQLELGRNVSTELGYNNYTSPNDLGLSARELFLQVNYDDTQSGRMALRPYGLIAGEVDARRVGSADCAQMPGYALGPALQPNRPRLACRGGSYAELGVTPRYDGGRFIVDVPVKVGFSVKDYYIHPVDFTNERWGFASIGALGTYPFHRTPSRIGSWNVHGGVQWYNLGSTPRAWNLNEDGRPRPNRVVGTVGVGFSY